MPNDIKFETKNPIMNDIIAIGLISLNLVTSILLYLSFFYEKVICDDNTPQLEAALSSIK
ncbi:hypothetical protein SFB4_182G1, partial [Candidatus Arthromitus sp. SFB-4]